MNKLLDFHLSCKDEYAMLLKKYNILFYGYGCKQNILKQLFPNTNIFNFRFQKTSNIIEELMLEGITTHNNIYDIDNELAESGNVLTLIILNFNFSAFEFVNLKNIRIIGTLENIDFAITKQDIEQFNFIYRDLTTFENYAEETIDIDLYFSKTTNALMVLESVSKKSKMIFCNLLKIGDCYLNQLFNAVKIRLMISKKQMIVDLLNEFVDHGIVKIIGGTNLTINLNKKDRMELLANEQVKQYLESK
ncbi:origin recognition complex sub 2 [Enterospora canceri]|uniref:Origin recognition complex sub 2 n=1 Tax=Enterospora canceri TaxID=1081671 RepID=A0A1Y1S9F7_9MICR|nr:origin recognition complex sub 2 [Enterospora canceri]